MVFVDFPEEKSPLAVDYSDINELADDDYADLNKVENIFLKYLRIIEIQFFYRIAYKTAVIRITMLMTKKRAVNVIIN